MPSSFPIRRLLIAFRLACLLAAGAFVAAAMQPATAAGETGPVSGLQVPRFVSLKSDKVNVRAGPTTEHQVRWVYTRAGLPVEITAEFENWRRIRDWEGAEGWVYHSLLSGRRTGLVVAPPRSEAEAIPIHASADADSTVVAKLQPGVLGSVTRCTGSWCRVSGSGYEGWVMQNRLWGVYPNEKLD